MATKNDIKELHSSLQAVTKELKDGFKALKQAIALKPSKQEVEEIVAEGMAEAVNTAVQSHMQPVNAAIQCMNGKISELFHLADSKRCLDARVQFTCALGGDSPADAAKYVQETLRKLGMADVNNIQPFGPFMIKADRPSYAKGPGVPASTRCWAVTFTAQSTPDIRMLYSNKASLLAEGAFMSIGDVLTQQEVEDKKALNNSKAFKEALEQARADKKPVRWALSKCKLGNELWDVERARAADAAAA